MDNKVGIDEKDYGEYIDKIESYIFQKYTVSEIKKMLLINGYYYDKIMQFLELSDLNRYERIKKQIKINQYDKVAEESKKNKIGILKNLSVIYQYAKKVAKGELSFLEACNESHITLLNFLKYLIELEDEELKMDLKPILFQFGIDGSKTAKKSLQTYPLKVQKEFLLLSLAYRVSFKNLSRILNTTVEDILYTFMSFQEYESSINYLFLETMNEEEMSEKLAFVKAKNYYLKRNKLMKSLKNATEGKEEIKQQIQELYHEIDDSLIKSIMGKNIKELTQEEKDFLAMYPIKYNLHLSDCERKFSISRSTFRYYQDDLAERKPIFADKLNIYLAKCDSDQKYYVEDVVKKSRGGGSR